MATGRLQDRVAFVTGAASGIGRASALRFANEGARVAGLDVASASDDGSDVRKAAPEVAFYEADVRDEAAVARAVDDTAGRFGRIDVLLNAAGVSGIGAVDVLEEAEWDRVVDINLKGTYLVSKHVARRMIEQRAGSIVNVSSVEGLEGIQQQAAYNASKGGVVLLTKNMAIDYGHLGIRVNCLCPGFIDTPMTQVLNTPELQEVKQRFVDEHMLGRAGRPEEVAAAALFLASEEASYVTGHALVVDGGFACGRRILSPEGP